MTARADLSPSMERVEDLYSWAVAWNAQPDPDHRADLVALAERQRAEFQRALAEHDRQVLDGYVKMPSREALRLEVQTVLFNASNYPPKVQMSILGTDTGPLTAKVTDAIVALLAGETS